MFVDILKIKHAGSKYYMIYLIFYLSIKMGKIAT